MQECGYPDSDRRRTCTRHGFTLLEVVIAVAVASIAFAGFIVLLSVLEREDAETLWATRALFCAQEKVETVKFDMATGSGFQGVWEEDLETGVYAGLVRSWAVRSFREMQGVAEIRVTCTYEWRGEERACALRTLVYSES